LLQSAKASRAAEETLFGQRINNHQIIVPETAKKSKTQETANRVNIRDGFP
jgi:hypothetical protein